VTRVRAIVARRRILALLIFRDLKVKYASSALGYFWTILEPLLMGLVYWFVFTKIFQRGGEVAREPYIVFLLAGLLPWMWASQVLSAAPRALSSEAKLVRSTNLPREIWVLRSVGSKFAEFMFALPVLVIFLLVTQTGVNWRIVFWPLAIGMQWAALLGIALILAPVTVLMVDLQNIVRVVTRVLFYMCPVLYGAHAVLDNPNIPGWVKQIYEMNPFTAILSLYRGAIFPDQHASWELILHGGISCVVLLGAGLWVFRNLERTVLKEI
jgi:ABC-2 type transport system permease protein